MTHTFPTRLSYELAEPELDRMRLLWGQPRPVAAIVCYRAQMQAGDVAPVAALASALTEAGLNPLPVFVTSLKDRLSADIVASLLDLAPPDVILNATSFAVGSPAQDGARSETTIR